MSLKISLNNQNQHCLLTRRYYYLSPKLENKRPAVFYFVDILVEKARSRAVDLISQAYSTISLETVAQMTGLTPEVAGSACLERGWLIEADTHMVHPIRPVQEEAGHTSSEDQLYKLTNFVSFLET